MKKKQMLLTVVMVLAVFAALTTAAAADTIAGDRTISPTSLPAGNTFTVTVDVTVTGTVYGPVLNEDIPAGWTVTEVDSAGASYSAAETTWIWLDEVTAGTKTVIYEVTVPTGTAAGNYPVTGTVLATVGGETIGPDGVTGNNLVTVIDGGTGETDTIAGDRTISPPSLPAGNTFTVTVDVIVTGTVYGPVLNEDIPAGWTVTEVANAGASYSAAETTWIWLDAVTDTTKTVVYDVTVPTGTADGDYPVTGTVLATVGGSTIGPYGVTGDDEVNVTDNERPEVTVNTPNGGEKLFGEVTLGATATDSDGSIFCVKFYYSNDSTWTYIGDGTTASDDYTCQWDTTTVADGTNYLIKAVATDDEGATDEDTSDAVFTVDNSCPCDFCLDLEAGWNFVSVPKKLNDSTDAVTVFNLTLGETCLYYDCVDGWKSNGAVNVVPCQGYWVGKVASDQICLDFAPGTGMSDLPEQELCQGWNMIGHIHTSPMSVGAFDSSALPDNDIAQLWQWSQTSGWEGYPFGDFTEMTPGQGYWLLVGESGTMYGTP